MIIPRILQATIIKYKVYRVFISPGLNRYVIPNVEIKYSVWSLFIESNTGTIPVSAMKLNILRVLVEIAANRQMRY